MYDAVFCISEIHLLENALSYGTETACNQWVEILYKCLMYNMVYYYSVLTYRD